MNDALSSRSFLARGVPYAHGLNAALPVSRLLTQAVPPRTYVLEHGLNAPRQGVTVAVREVHYPITQRFGQRLRLLRKERNLTQARMAVEFGIDRSFISDVERGKKAISLSLLEVIAIGFDLSLSDLMKSL